MAYLTTLTRIPFGPNSSAMHLENMSTEALAKQYAEHPAYCQRHKLEQWVGEGQQAINK